LLGVTLFWETSIYTNNISGIQSAVLSISPAFARSHYDLASEQIDLHLAGSYNYYSYMQIVAQAAKEYD